LCSGVSPGGTQPRPDLASGDLPALYDLFGGDGVHKQPLMYAALASQKNHMAVYLTAIYMDDDARERFEADYRQTGKRMDAGESCVRFRKLDDVPLEFIVRAISYMEMAEFVSRVEALRSRKAKNDEGARRMPGAFRVDIGATVRTAACPVFPGSQAGTRE